MRLHQDVYCGLELLLPAGKVLNAADVDFLQKRCPGTTLLVADLILDELVNFDDERHSEDVARVTQNKLVDLLSGVQSSFASRISLKSMDCGGIEDAVGGVMDHLEANPVMAMKLMHPDQGEHYLVTHSAHVFYLSLVMGNAVRDLVHKARRENRLRVANNFKGDLDLTPLALAALFMDLGMWPLRDFYTQTTSLTEDQCIQIRNHPVVSAEGIPRNWPDLTKLIIETHHENFDGTGYPYGLMGEELHFFARILRIADAYAAATSTQTYKEAVSPARALWEMTWGPFNQFYDPILRKIFASLLHPYPIGSRLGLNTGQGAVVVRYGKVSPFLPEIVIAFDEEGNRYPNDRLRGPLKLEKEPDLSITEFDGEDVSDLYDGDTHYTPVTTDEFSTLYEIMYSSGFSSASR